MDPGITVGLIIIPQAMSYAKIATLPVQYGLYSAYIGALFYVLMGTSREIDIGPTSVISLITASLIAQYEADHEGAPTGLEGHQLASMACLVAGAIVLFLGLFRLGMVLDFIPETVLAGFTTGSAITIISCQIPKWIGAHGVSSHDLPLVVLFNSLKAIPTLSWMDAVFGISSLIFLVIVGSIADRFARQDRAWLRMLKISRFFIITTLATVASYIILSSSERPTTDSFIGKSGNSSSSNIGMITPTGTPPMLSILKTVPSGLPAPTIPPLEWSLLRELTPKMIAIVLIMVLEHVAVAKSIAQQSQYQVDTSQELTTLGLANITASFFGAYAVSGAFSRSAVKHQCSVKSPLSGFFSSALVLLAIHFLTPLFYYIPDSALSAVIIVAVSSLICLPRVFIHFYKVSVWDFVTSQITLWVTLLVSVEMGIMAGVGFSLTIMLFRIARPSCYGLAPLSGRPDVFVNMRRLSGKREDIAGDQTTTHGTLRESFQEPILASLFDSESSQDPIPAGVLAVRMDEAALFPNINIFRSYVLDQVYLQARFGGLTRKAEDRLWSDNRELYIRRLRQSASDRKGIYDCETDMTDEGLGLPRLAAVIIDCSAMNRVDSTGLDGLVRLRESLEEYAGARDDPNLFFELHFVAVNASVLRVLHQSTLLQRTRLSVISQELSGEQFSCCYYGSGFSTQRLAESNDRDPNNNSNVGSGNDKDRSKQANTCQVGIPELTRPRRICRTVLPSNTNVGTGELVHWTIRDALDAIMEHGREWAVALEVGSMGKDKRRGERGSLEDDHDSLASIEV
ncbi:hypothetical protein BGW38_003401 [Lunasporangiospora selenospora]|uniref:STAS domain-containing protein n=1 Tax=Lunasporangiospora selenospora TaxID=979761 RepID=A0A9P6G0H2_9FUNG|nr:hypothetical protein BGW38_003401 [Lunasporangiospora selenospora]